MTANVAVHGFGMKVVEWSVNLTQEMADEQAKSLGLPAGSFTAVGSKQELLQRADVLTIHYVLSERSRDIIGAEDLAQLKPTALLVNTSRGPLVNEQALLDALLKRKIQGAALDVYDTEPLARDSVWRTTPWGRDGRSEVLLSPHMGYVEDGVMNLWYDENVETVENWLDGKELRNKL
jgi:glycerate dehydrogenase